MSFDQGLVWVASQAGGRIRPIAQPIVRAAFGVLLPKAVYSFAFERESQGDRIVQLKGVLRRLTVARDAGAVG